MTVLEILLLTATSMSVIGNVYLFRRMSKYTRGAGLKKDLRLLSDLMEGGSTLIKITRIAPQDYFVRSPRDLI